MSIVQPGDRWSVGICEDVIVWAFASATEFSAFTEQYSTVYRRLLDRCDIAGMVTMLDCDDVIDTSTIDWWDEAASIASGAGVARWAIVARKVNARILETLEVGGVETLTTRDPAVALEWARSI